MPNFRTLLPAFLCLIPIAAAQQNSSVTGATITGHIVCSDTNAPARFARVLLKSTSGSSFGDAFLKNIQKNLAKSGDPDAAKPLTEEDKRQMAAISRSMDKAGDMLNSSTVGLDGSYMMTNVKPGTYYVHAIYAGYVDTLAGFSDDDFSSTDPAIRARVAQLPTVTIQGDESVRVDLRLDRGAAISGRILYPDGTPASGWNISVIKPKTPEDPGEAMAAAMSQALASTGSVPIFKTDDRGNFRISGLQPGDYAIRASLMATAIGVSAANVGDGGSGIKLTVYSGDTFSRDDAKPIHLVASDEQSGILINIPANKLHNIAGHVTSKADGHTVNDGSVVLASKENPAVSAVAAIRDDGSFQFEYLPPGRYTLTVAAAFEVRRKPSKPGFMGISVPQKETLKKYDSATADVLLADSDSGNIHLSVAPTKWVPSDDKPVAAPKPGDVLNDLFSDDGSDDKTPESK